MKSNQIMGALLAISLMVGLSSAASAKNRLPWPYGDRGMNELAMQIYAQQQLEKQQQAGYYNPYANPYGYNYGNPYLNNYVNPYSNYIGQPYGLGGWY